MCRGAELRGITPTLGSISRMAPRSIFCGTSHIDIKQVGVCGSAK